MEAQLAVDLMRQAYERRVEALELSKGNDHVGVYLYNIKGLIIKKAFYQKAPSPGWIPEPSATSSLSYPVEECDRLNVTVPLQMLVVDSQIYLDRTSKADLLGFFDVAIGHPKILIVEYLFRGSEHYAIVGDDEEFLAPFRQHLVQ